MRRNADSDQQEKDLLKKRTNMADKLTKSFNQT